MRIFKRAAISIMALSLLVTGLVGCGDNSGKTVITFDTFSASDGQEEYLKQMIAEYNKTHSDVEIEPNILGYSDYFDQLKTKATGGNTADIFELDTGKLSIYADNDIIEPLDSYTTSSDLSVYQQGVLNVWKSNGNLYALPNSMSTVLLFYNKDLFDQANIAYPTADWTWEDIDTAGASLSALGSDYYGIIQPDSYFEFFKLLEQSGGNLLNNAGTEFTVNSAAGREVVQMLKDRRDNLVTPTATVCTDEWAFFKEGKTGMLVTGIWAFPTFNSTTDPLSFNYDIVVEPGNVQKATHVFSNAYCVSSDSKVKAEAFEFIKFITSNEACVKIRADAGWELPPVTYDFVKTSYLSAASPANRAAVFDSMAYGISVPSFADSSLANDIITKYIQKVTRDTMTVADAMAACQAELETKVKL
jgi:multiple sugar transport system substrate-binding protein